MSQAKRPYNFNDVNTLNAPNNYQVKKANKKKFIESSKRAPSARRENTINFLMNGLREKTNSDSV